MEEKRWALGHPMPHWRLANGILNLAANSGDRVIQHLPDPGTSIRTERNGDGGDDTSRNDHVLERHDAGRVLAQALQGFGGLDVIFQHKRKSFYKMNCCNDATFVGPCCQ